MNANHDAHHTLAGAALQQAIDGAVHRLPAALSDPMPLDDLLRCVQRFRQRLASDRDVPGLTPPQRAQLLHHCSEQALCLKIERELGIDPWQLRRIDYRSAHFEAWRPLGCVLHIMPSNAPLLPFLATLESLLVGNVNWVRPSSGDTLTRRLVELFIDGDDTDRLRAHIHLWPIASGDIHHLLPHVDGVSAWGGDAALQAVQRQLKPGCRWIAWGHKISFIYLTPAAQDAVTDEALYDGIADEVCRLNQQACSSPQLVLVDSTDSTRLRHTGERLARAMQRRTGCWPTINLDVHQQADVGTACMMARLDNAFRPCEGQVWEGEDWRVIWQHQVALEASASFRSLLLRPMPRARLVTALLPWRSYLQTCGLQCTKEEIAAVTDTLLRAGVGRITAPGDMHDGYIGEPHDNARALTRFARRVSAGYTPDMVAGHGALDAPPPRMPLAQAPIMGRDTFARGINDKARLFFRSGGTSSTPVLSAFSYRDYHRQMQAAADGLFAAGLDPSTDRVLNLLAAGSLYGGMLSSFLALDKLDAVHFPMGSPQKSNALDIAALIARHGIDTLIGVPSEVYHLFRRAEAPLRAYGGVRKIFLGGQHLLPSQRAFLESFGVGLIRSALYGSNDAGPLGHACARSEEGVFHLLSEVQQIEVVAREADVPVPAGEAGRLLITSHAREAQEVIRYDIGDLGCLIDQPCACGRTTPRFRLLGRHGNFVRLGYVLIDVDVLVQRVGVAVQFEVDAPDGVDRLRVFVDGDVHAAQHLLCTMPQLANVLDEELLVIETMRREQMHFICQPHSAKPVILRDLRALPTTSAHRGPA